MSTSTLFHTLGAGSARLAQRHANCAQLAVNLAVNPRWNPRSNLQRNCTEVVTATSPGFAVVH
jgi:hypothetical protein